MSFIIYLFTWISSLQALVSLECRYYMGRGRGHLPLVHGGLEHPEEAAGTSCRCCAGWRHRWWFYTPFQGCIGALHQSGQCIEIWIWQPQCTSPQHFWFCVAHGCSAVQALLLGGGLESSAMVVEHSHYHLLLVRKVVRSIIEELYSEWFCVV